MFILVEIKNNFSFIFLFSWNQDPKCNGPFPIAFATIEKSLKMLRKSKYQSSPKTIEDIRIAFENREIIDDIGTSLHREHGKIFNLVHEDKDYSYCVFSSPKSIQLFVDEVDDDEHFLLIDGTFRITPMCDIFKQVLIIHAQFGLKVCKFSNMKSK